MTAPNQLWTVDHKGWFLTGDGERCYPLTICDQFSRYLFACRGATSTASKYARAAMEKRVPFANMAYPLQFAPTMESHSPGSELQGSQGFPSGGFAKESCQSSSSPGSPEQNGRHERMHRTLADEATIPAAFNCARQQHRFDEWRTEFNELRPHEALGGRTPASVHTPSTRKNPYNERPPRPEYPLTFRSAESAATAEFDGKVPG